MKTDTKRSRSISIPTVLTATGIAAVLMFTGCATNKQPPKVSREQAEAVAQTESKGGRIVSAELEREHGRLIWSFDITIPNSKDIREIQVDANSGDVVNREIETPAQQAQEANDHEN